MSEAIENLPSQVRTFPPAGGFNPQALVAIGAEIYDYGGQEVGIPCGGYLALDRPCLSMLPGIWRDERRFKDTHGSRFGEGATSPVTARNATPAATSGCSSGSTT